MERTCDWCDKPAIAGTRQVPAERIQPGKEVVSEWACADHFDQLWCWTKEPRCE